MIVFCDAQQRKQALAMWKQHATSFEVSSLDTRFQMDWLESDVVATIHDTHMGAFMMEQKRVIKCGPHHVAITYCPWIVKAEDEDVFKLLQSRLMMHAHQCLASIIISDDENLMRSHHAKPWVITQTINLSKSMIEPLSFAMVTFECPLSLVAQAYNAFTQRFESTLIRHEKDFELHPVSASTRRKRAGIIEEERLLGYMDYELSPYGFEIKELIYENVDTLLRLLSFAASMHHHIVIHASSAERFEKIFPNASISKKVESWIVLHHPSLWSQLFKQDVAYSDDLARILHKPIMMHTK